ncbi:hypothetical protein L3X38_008105 [Prunus dulcis]|uniref:Uncharacterized protein n=1 Tax=Prunus dulcis TaxID=3755 RepID=A0AAD4ZVS8_PRUDU|nr:hypothetical protein L3X38_008105 [Prunus dulcis]
MYKPKSTNTSVPFSSLFMHFKGALATYSLASPNVKATSPSALGLFRLSVSSSLRRGSQGNAILGFSLCAQTALDKVLFNGE